MTDDRIWTRFDGWCAARTVDPLALPLHRMLNLLYAWMTEGRSKDQVEAVDDALDEMTALHARVNKGTDGVPSWWSDDDDAGGATMALMARMTRPRRR